jgi:hypothetical protein
MNLLNGIYNTMNHIHKLKAICLAVIAIKTICFSFAFANVEPQKVSTSKFNSSFGYYHSSPESPDGKRIAYTVFKESGQGAEIWVCKTDFTGHMKIADVPDFTIHNGTQNLWIDNETLAYMEGHNTIKTIFLDTGKIVEPIASAAHLGHNTSNGNILAVVLKSDRNVEPEGIYEVNPRTGHKKMLINPEEIEKKYRKIINHNNEWKVRSLWHPMYSPNQKIISLRVDVGTKSSTLEKLLMTFETDNKNNTLFITPTPLHSQWYDNDSVIGYNRVKPENSLLRWQRNGNVTEIIAGSGNHFTFNKDLTYIVTDSFYESSPIYLFIYKRNQIKPIHKIYLTMNTELIWNEEFHINPSFSSDGSRIYFNSVYKENNIYASYISTSDLMDVK